MDLLGRFNGDRSMKPIKTMQDFGRFLHSKKSGFLLTRRNEKTKEINFFLYVRNTFNSVEQFADFIQSNCLRYGDLVKVVLAEKIEENQSESIWELHVLKFKKNNLPEEFPEILSCKYICNLTHCIEKRVCEIHNTKKFHKMVYKVEEKR